MQALDWSFMEKAKKLKRFCGEALLFSFIFFFFFFSLLYLSSILCFFAFFINKWDLTHLYSLQLTQSQTLSSSSLLLTSIVHDPPKVCSFALICSNSLHFLSDSAQSLFLSVSHSALVWITEEVMRNFLRSTFI